MRSRLNLIQVILLQSSIFHSSSSTTQINSNPSQSNRTTKPTSLAIYFLNIKSILPQRQILFILSKQQDPIITIIYLHHKKINRQTPKEYRIELHRQQQLNNNTHIMENQFECTKIKDGLYLASLAPIQDYQFLQINKFSYIVNCSAEIPNYFDNHGIKYLKFKLIKERSHKLWDQNLKKLRKLQKFVQEAEEQSLCCIIFSSGGNNRSLVMLTAYLMSKYRWTLNKTLQYIRSKKIFIGLSEHYIQQLELLQTLLTNEPDKLPLSLNWKGPYSSEEEEIISKTYMNSQDLPIEPREKKEKKLQRVTWQDKIDKEKKKEAKEIKMKQTGIEPFKKNKSSHKFQEQSINPHNSLSTKILRNQTMQSPLKKSQNLKKVKKNTKNVSVNKFETICNDKKEKEEFVQFEEESQQKQIKEPVKEIEQNRFFSQKELLKLIKKNLKMKKQDNKKEPANKNEQNQDKNQVVNQKGIYRLTINNFIAPNINIMNNVTDKPPENKINKNPPKVVKKEDKNMRTQSQKDPITKANNDSIKIKPQKPNKSYKRNTQNSPKMRQKKLQKAVSLQFKKNL